MWKRQKILGVGREAEEGLGESKDDQVCKHGHHLLPPAARVYATPRSGDD